MEQRPIVSCRPMGRLGNYLFQAAAVLGYAERYKTHDAVFSFDCFGHYCQTMFRKLKYGNIPRDCMLITDPADFSYNSQLPYSPYQSVWFDGYMQSEKYFAHCSYVIKSTFSMSNEVLGDLSARYGDKLRCEPVSIHVRRGDFLCQQDRYPVQPVQYYLNALGCLSERVSVSHVLCFSDDPEWCDEHLARVDKRITVVRQNDAYLDLALMTLCSHHVIANSTFSWWGAWRA